MTKPYRPSNGSEGEAFIATWCAHCLMNANDENPCCILGNALMHDVDDAGFPDKWVYRGKTPVCTGFFSNENSIADEPVYRCDETPDMFGERL